MAQWGDASWQGWSRSHGSMTCHLALTLSSSRVKLCHNYPICMASQGDMTALHAPRAEAYMQRICCIDAHAVVHRPSQTCSYSPDNGSNLRMQLLLNPAACNR